VAEGADAQLLQVLCGHPAQDLAVDVIVAKKLGVLFEAQPVQPSPRSRVPKAAGFSPDGRDDQSGDLRLQFCGTSGDFRFETPVECP